MGLISGSFTALDDIHCEACFESVDKLTSAAPRMISWLCSRGVPWRSSAAHEFTLQCPGLLLLPRYSRNMLAPRTNHHQIEACRHHHALQRPQSIHRDQSTARRSCRVCRQAGVSCFASFALCTLSGQSHRASAIKHNQSLAKTKLSELDNSAPSSE